MPRGTTCALAALLALTACGPAPATRDPHASGAKAATPGGPRLALSIELENRTLRVRVEASGSAEELRWWRLGEDVEKVVVVDGGDHVLPSHLEGRRLEVT